MKKPNLLSLKKSDEDHVAKTETDILHLITEDHRQLRRLLPALQDVDVEMQFRKSSFDEFALLLESHLVAKEQSLYFVMKRTELFRTRALRLEAMLHDASERIAEIREALDGELWSHQVKALADVIDKHLHDEGRELLPDYAESTDLYECLKVGRMFLKVKESFFESDPMEKGDSLNVLIKMH